MTPKKPGLLSLFRSRKVLLAVLTSVASLLKPEIREEVIIVGTVLIGAIALEDAAGKFAHVEPEPAPLFPPEPKP